MLVQSYGSQAVQSERAVTALGREAGKHDGFIVQPALEPQRLLFAVRSKRSGSGLRHVWQMGKKYGARTREKQKKSTRQNAAARKDRHVSQPSDGKIHETRAVELQQHDLTEKQPVDGHEGTRALTVNTQQGTAIPDRAVGITEGARTYANSTVPVDQQSRQKTRFHNIILTTKSATEAWEAYQALLYSYGSVVTCAEGRTVTPLPHLHRLAHLLASSKPRTRTLFLNLLDVLSRLRRIGGTVHLWEWNALIDCAGKGFRKTRIEDYKTALGVFNDMISGPQDYSLSQDIVEVPRPAVTPDIVTYTTLLDIASRSMNPTALRHASLLLRSSHLLPNRITNLVLLRYRMKTDKLKGARDVFKRIAEEGRDGGLDGINAFLWAHVQEGQFDVAFRVYDHLRQHVVEAPDAQKGCHHVEEDHLRHQALPIFDAQNENIGENKSPERDTADGDIVEGLFVPIGMKPDEITYTLMIQGLSYHGHLVEALQVWSDMLTSPKEGFASKDSHAGVSAIKKRYGPSLPVFRALFCGFARHGKPPAKLPEFTSRLSGLYSRPSPWNLDNLTIVLDGFLNLPHHVKPSERTFYWIMVAFGKTSSNDIKKLREVWNRIEDRFPGPWGGRLGKLAKMLSRTGGKGKVQE